MAETPEERLHAFRTDYMREHAAAEPLFERGGLDGFNVWVPAVERLEHDHGTDGGGFRLGTTFSRPAEHDPDQHPVTSVAVDADSAVIRTDGRDDLPGITEYALRRVAGDWRLDGLATFVEDPDSLSLTPDEAASRRDACSPDAPMVPLPWRERMLDPDLLFRPRAVTDSDGEAGKLSVREVGVIDTRSGRLTVVDLTYPTDMAWPLLRSVPPGRYPVDASVVFDRNAALRVHIGAATPVRWHPAVAASGGHIFGVDGGNLCVADFDAYVAQTVRRHDRLSDDYAMVPDRPVARSLGGPDGTAIGVVADSGWGDGAYGAYWGVDAAGRPQQLVVLFGLLIDDGPSEQVDIAWRSGPLPDARLAAAGISLAVTQRWRRARLDLTDPDEHVQRFTVTDPDGHVHADVGRDDLLRPADGAATYELARRPRDGARIRIELEPQLRLR